MDKQKEALSRIVGTVHAKFKEAETFAYDIHSQMEAVQNCYKESIYELNNQFQILVESLQKSRSRMIAEIEAELFTKTAPLRESLQSFDEAKQDAEDLIAMSNNVLEMTSHNEFSQAALRIKDRITMSPIFRLSFCPIEVDENCFFFADFSRERSLFSKLTFLPVPNQPEIIQAACFAENNIVHCLWSVADDDDHADVLASICSEVTDQVLPSPVEYFVLQYRQVETSSDNTPWVTVEFVRSFQYDIKGLNFHKPTLEFRVQAWNKALGGNWSKVCAILTPAFKFSFNAEAVHPNLKILSFDKVEWDANANKLTQDQRVKSAGMARSASPVKNTSSSPRRSKPKDRFTGESYTVLGDTVFSDEEAYFEVASNPECKTYSIGVTLKSLARFDQLGRTPTSWCLHVSNWIQNTFVAKHNNKVKNLESCGEVPTRIGVYFNLSTGILSFYNAQTHQHVYTFKQVKCNGPIIPGFLVWFGSMQVFTGIQVPSWIVTRPSSSLNNKSDSSSSKIKSSSATPSPEEEESIGK